MTAFTTHTLDQLLEHDRTIDFEAFDHADAWAVGQRILAIAHERSAAITAAIWLGEQRVFHAGLRGTSADNDQWMERKAALVRRYDASSWFTTHRLREYGIVEESARMGLDASTHTLSGGGFPIRVRGTAVGVAVVSGISDDADHTIVVEALRGHLEDQSAPASGRAIRHTVVFRLLHEHGSDAEAEFLDTAAKTLTAIDGVVDFAVNRQVSAKSDLDWQISMVFADQASYDAYNAHPSHVAFVESRWQSDVAVFQEYDFAVR
ncbi:heme-binding protein [Arthrobacter sp. KNU40]|uniref:heme-binding protein n=1 Tax=Arthrobacter sp. KNU40 TaxID=3447965 RepID=UPI003F5D840D